MNFSGIGVAALASVMAVQGAPQSIVDRGAVTDGRYECRGEPATAVVQAGETWIGTHERDVVVVLGNGAEVWTNFGDDLVCVYGSNSPTRYGHGSAVYAADGNNTVITYGGSNFIQTSGTGRNLIFLNGDMEEVETSDGDDHIWALGASSARVYSGGGNDLIVGSPGADYLDAGAGQDVVLGNGGQDRILGGAGMDKLFGGAGFDEIDGGDGDDTCIDQAGGADFVSCETIQSDPGFPEGV